MARFIAVEAVVDERPLHVAELRVVADRRVERRPGHPRHGADPLHAQCRERLAVAE
jgi:hypothetical protein